MIMSLPVLIGADRIAQEMTHSYLNYLAHHTRILACIQLFWHVKHTAGLVSSRSLRYNSG